MNTAQFHKGRFTRTHVDQHSLVHPKITLLHDRKRTEDEE